MNKLIRTASFILVLVMISVLGMGCSKPKPADEAEVHAAAKELVMAAVEVNRMFFWEGLPQEKPVSVTDIIPNVTDETEEVSSIITENVTESSEISSEEAETEIPYISPSEYAVLEGDYKYFSEEDLMTKAINVYSAAFCEDIKRICFEGVVVNEDDLLYPRYVVEMGVMKINRKISAEGLPERIPKPDTIQTVYISHNSAIVSMEFECEGKIDRQEITLKLEKAGWRLDTPTY